MQSQLPSRTNGILVSPWQWMGVGIGLVATALVWYFLAASVYEPGRFALVWLGLLCAGIGLASHLQRSEATLSVAAPVRLLFLVAMFSVMALAATANLIASWCGHYWIGFRPGLCLVVWVFVAPLSARAAWLLLRRLPAGARLESGDVASLALLAFGATAFLAVWALNTVDPDRMSWFTIQRFLVVTTYVAWAMAPLPVVDVLTRRIVVSGMVAFHLGGIVTAALGSPPTPTVVNQLWVRIYRPYLQFIYMNNAYHFYSPSPGPPSYLWFRLYYTDAQGAEKAEWYKIPHVDDNGRHGHAASLEYQRYLSITTNTENTEGFLTDSDLFQRALALRLAWTPEKANKDGVVGQAPLKGEILIPMQRNVGASFQYNRPQLSVQWLMESLTRHVLRKYADKHPDRKYTSLRVYRVIHHIPPTGHFLHDGLEATDPETYSPVYMGEYGPDGKLLDPDSPFLYWRLPIQRDLPTLDSNIRDWAQRHAGERYWIRVIRQGFYVWVDEDGKAEGEAEQ